MIDRWRLLLFREVSRLGTVAAAAEAVHVTPSAVSQQLQLLQRETGLTLFEKNGRRVQLTPAALVFLDYANAILGSFEAAEVALAIFRREVVGTVRLAAFPSAAKFVAPPAISAAQREHAGLQVVLHELEPDEAIDQLKGGQQDIAVIDDLDPNLQAVSESLTMIPLFQDPLVVALPRDHRLRDRASITLADLAEESWITERSGKYFEKTLRQACANEGFEPRVSAFCRDVGVTLALIEAGCGVAVLPRLTVSGSGAIAVCALHPKWIRSISVVTRTSTADHPAIHATARSLISAGRTYMATQAVAGRKPLL